MGDRGLFIFSSRKISPSLLKLLIHSRSDAEVRDEFLRTAGQCPFPGLVLRLVEYKRWKRSILRWWRYIQMHTLLDNSDSPPASDTKSSVCRVSVRRKVDCRSRKVFQLIALLVLAWGLTGESAILLSLLLMHCSSSYRLIKMT